MHANYLAAGRHRLSSSPSSVCAQGYHILAAALFLPALLLEPRLLAVALAIAAAAFIAVEVLRIGQVLPFPL